MTPRAMATGVLAAAIAFQLYCIVFLFRAGATIEELVATLGAELPLATRTFLRFHRFAAAVPVVSIVLAADLLRRRDPGATHAALVMFVVVGAAFALNVWATEAWFRPMFELINAIGGG